VRARAVLAILLLVVSLPVWAQRLPVRRYRQADGLAHEQVRVIRQDGKGYLWIGTGEGVSRFDGYQFVTFGAAHGLAVPLINDIAVDAGGRVWVATNGSGVARFVDDPADRASSAGAIAGDRFQSFRIGPDTPSNQVNAVVFADEAMWCATDRGLFRADLSKTGDPVFTRVGRSAEPVVRAFKDSRGRLWFATEDRGIIQPSGEGLRVVGATPDRARIIGLDEYEGRLVVASTSGVYEWAGELSGGQAAWQSLPLPLRQRESLYAIRTDSQGNLWIGTTAGVIRYRRGQFSRMALLGDEIDRSVRSVFEDRDHNVWVGTDTDGLIRVVNQGIVSFTVSDGLPETGVVGLTTGADGAIYASSGTREWARILNDRVTTHLGLETAAFSGIGRQLKCAPSSFCWALTPAGLYRIDQTPLRFGQATLFHRPPPGAGIVTLGGNGLYRDQAGDIWFATTEPALYRVGAADGPGDVTREPLELADPMAPLARDRAGAVWLGNFIDFGRLRGSRVETIRPDDGLDHSPRCAFVDSQGRLWIGLRYGGAVMTADPAADAPTWVRYSTRNGLASDTVWAITEDRRGRMYFATNRGLDQLEPATGQVRHFTTENGLASAVLYDGLTDAQGRIWLASAGGVSRFDPLAETAPTLPPSIFIRRVEVGDRVVPLPGSGADRLAGIEVPPGSDRVVIQFSGIPLGSQDRTRYRYRLDGLDTAWSALTTDRTVTYGRLGSGQYRFSVVAVDDVSGRASVNAATVQFAVLPPIWKRSWFLVSAALGGVGITLFTAARRRARRRAVEAFRRQVATDLHDDVGSGLSSIAVLSEVLRRQAVPPLAEGLADIARVARNLRESMSDIVWAIGPDTDRPSDLVNRMRQTAFTMLDFEGLRVEFDAPPAEVLDQLSLPADRRRHVLLIFKETVTNVARHARASHLSVRITLARDRLSVVIRDNGCGFDPATVSRGQGLNSLARRATAMAAVLTIDSCPGDGTRVELSVRT